MTEQHGKIELVSTVALPAERIRLKPAAELLGVHAETLRRWARDGMIRYWEVGKGRYMEFDPRDISALDYSFRRDPADSPTA